jgi:hypothetical protein
MMPRILYVTSVLIDAKPNGQDGSEVSLVLSSGDILGGLRMLEIPGITQETDHPAIRIEVEIFNPNEGDDTDETDELDWG